MASNSDNLYITFADVDNDLLKVWGQRNRISATYIEKQLSQLVPEFNRISAPNPSLIRKGMFCFVKKTVHNYYRARVISNIQGNSVGVLFVDYGNKDIVSISNIRIPEGIKGDVSFAKMVEQAEDYYLARVSAPSGGWTKEIISEIRQEICCDEFECLIIHQVGDQKILEIRFQNDDFSNYLIKKQIARHVTVATQTQMILSYCSLVSNDPKLNGPAKEMSKLSYSIPPPPLGVPLGERFLSQQPHELRQQNYGRRANTMNFSPSGQYSPAVANRFQKTNSNHSFYPIQNQSPINENPAQQMSPISSLAGINQCSPINQMKGNPSPLLNSFNNVMIEALAQQIKQYIVEDNMKSGSNAAKDVPHNYLNSVLEVGSTHNVLISYIDDGPWSFSIQLLSSESELNNLMDELTNTELVPIKPPILLGHPCIAASKQYENLCRGVIVSISHTAVKVYFVDFGNTEDLPVTSIYELPPKFFKTRVLSQKFSLSGLQKVAHSDDINKFFKEVVQDELLMLRVTSLEGDNLPNCELFLKEKNIKRILNEKIRESRSYPPEDSPKVGETENVVVTWVESPQKFFVQLRKRDPELESLKKELEEYSVTGLPVTFQQLGIGFKCICQYDADKEWYRAVITSLDSESAITVFYLDYGNTETVNITFLKKVEGSTLINQMTAQAIQCSLKGFENEPYDEQKTNNLIDLILEKDLKMTVDSSQNDHICVKLFENGKDVSQLLLDCLHQPNIGVNANTFQNHAGGRKEPSAKEGHEKTFNPFEKKNKFSESSLSFDRRDNWNFGEDKNSSASKEKIKSGRHFTAPKNKEPRSTHRQLQKRSEEKGNWRDDKWKFDVHPHSSDRCTGGKAFKQDKENYRSERKPQGSDQFGASRGRKLDRGSDGWNDRKLNDDKREGSRGLKQSKENDARNDRDKFGDRKKFGESQSEKERFFDSKAPDGKKFEKKNRGWGESSRDNFDTRKKIITDRSNKFERRRKVDESACLRKDIKKEDVAPVGSKFEERNVEMGMCEKAIVTFYLNPHEFYVQLLSQEDDFKKMMHDIQSFYSDKYSIKDPLQTGDIVISQFSIDKILYRAEVIRPMPVTVRYVDYGNQEVIGPKKSWVVAKRFLDLPKQAVKCRLFNVQPLGSYWPPPGSEIDKFFEEEEYKCTFISTRDGVYEIKMESVESGKDVATEILSTGLAAPTPPKLDIPEIDYSLLPYQTLRLYVPHVENHSKFYVIINPKSVKVIEEEIKAYVDLKKSLPSLQPSLLQSDCVCLVEKEVNSWHRALITKKQEENISVWFCDRGDTIEVTADKVKVIPDHLKCVQPQVVECYLLKPEVMTSKEEFKTQLERRHHLITFEAESEGKFAVTLFDLTGKKSNFHKNNDSLQNVEPIGQLPVVSQVVPVTISSFKSPKEIYIQNSCDCDAISDLSEKLRHFYEKKEGYHVSERERYVAAKSIICGSWSRGRVVSSSDDIVEIFYIDYGHVESLPKDNVRKLDVSFYDLSAFARKVALQSKHHEDTTQNFSDRLSELTDGKKVHAYFVNVDGEMLVEFVVNGRKITETLMPALQTSDAFAKIVMKDLKPSDPKHDEGCLRVFVSHIANPNQFWVHQESSKNDLQHFEDQLQRHCKILPVKSTIQTQDVVAALFSDTWYRAKVLKVKRNNLTVQFIDYGNILDVPSEGVKELPAELLEVPVFATCYALKGKWNDNAATKFEEIILQHPEDPVSVFIVEDGNPVIVDLFKDGQSIAEKLTSEMNNDLITVYITHSNSPEDFFVQKESCTEFLDSITNRLLNADGFDNVSHPQENELYVAKFTEDDMWYRAKLLRRNQDDYEVHFIDYGNASRVTEIKVLVEDLKEIPELAENCCIVYGNKNDAWSEAACEKFLDYADGRPLKMKVIVSGRRSIVKLYSDEGNVSEELEALCEDDGRFDAYISHVNSPSDFYIHYKDADPSTLADKLNGDGDELDDKKLGAMCQARFPEDGLWYRAKILQNVDPGWEVFFVDYGNVAVVTEIKKLTEEIEAVQPLSIRCSLNLPERNIPESVKEEFINLTAGSESVFRAKIITPGEVNVVSLKLDGRILERTLTLDTLTSIAEEVASFRAPTQGQTSNPQDDETDDDKNSRVIGSYTNLETRAGISIRNETDEEKRVKIAIADGGSEGFKSDDEKGITEVLASIVNATDNDLIEESEGTEEVQEETGNQVEESEQVLVNGESVEEDGRSEPTKTGVTKADKQPNSDRERVLDSVSEQLVIHSTQQSKRGVSLEALPCDGYPKPESSDERQSSQSAPNTPQLGRRENSDDPRKEKNDPASSRPFSTG